jgi:hypothetical protein
MLNARREVILRAHIDKHLAEGGILIYMGWGLQADRVTEKWAYDPQFKSPCTCALGSVLLGQTTAGNKKWLQRYTAIAELLECNREWINAFLDGYDNCGKESTYNHDDIQAYSLGRRLRKDYKPVETQTVEKHEH